MSKQWYTDKRSGIQVGNLGHPFAQALVAGLRDSDHKTTELCADLRRRGVRALHPDDGWVNREKNYVQFAYPDFNDGPQVGDSIALGWHDRYRIVVVISVDRKVFAGHDMTRYYFRDIAA